MPKKVENLCFVCKSSENVVVTFPSTKEIFDKWIEILQIKDEIKPNQRKKLCILHFDSKWHNILLNGTRGPYIFPDPPIQNNDNTNKQLFAKRSISPSPTTLHNTNKKPVNYELLLKIKNDEINDLSTKLSELKLQNEMLQKENTELVSVKNQHNDLPENVRTFIKLLSSPNSKSKRYEKAEKQICQTLYYRNPGFYQFLSQTLNNCLPTKTTLLHWQAFKSLPIGIVPEMIAYLKDINSTLDDNGKKVVLILDEMDGRRGLMYDESRDCIVGFECLVSKTKKLAKKFLTIMIRGMNRTLGNLIIANFATENGITGEQLAQMLPIVIRMLKNIGFQVVFSCMDQSAVNRKAYSLLGVNAESPFYFVDDLKVYAIFDVPHLFKSNRTTFLEYQMESCDGKILGQIVKDAYLADKRASTRLFPKLTDEHFFYDTFQKMRVNLAVQVLSNSVADGLKKMLDNGFFRSNSRVVNNTITFVKNMDSLFDLLNGSNSNDSKENKRGITKHNIEKLKELSTYVSSISKTDKGKVYWISGLRQTVCAVIEFFESNQKNHEDFVLFTKHLNQDPIENLFGLVRARGGNNRNPYLIDFLRIVSQIMTSKLLITLTETNCEFNASSSVTVLDLDKFSIIKDTPVI